jgi:hypothetical protein
MLEITTEYEGIKYRYAVGELCELEKCNICPFDPDSDILCSFLKIKEEKGNTVWIETLPV